MTKIAQPVNPLIYRTAAEMAAVFYEAGRSSGMTSRHKDAKHYAAEYLERFIPLAVKQLLEMLKPHSGISEHMKEEIHAALTDPINDPDLMEGKKGGLPNIDINVLMRGFEKNKILTPIQSQPKTVLHR